MTDLFVNKVKTATAYALMPAHQQDLEAIKSLPNNVPLRVKVTRMRNVQFHRKWWALVNYAYDCWTPDESNQVGEKNFDRFRKDIIILAGFYERYVRLNGETRIEPKSISFASMSEDEFSDLYTKTVDVIIKHVLRNYTGEELRIVVDGILEFDG